MKINGAYIELNGIQSLEKLLLSENFNMKRIVAVLNGTIVPRSEYDNVILNDEDSIEVVNFVGGG